MSEPPAVQEPKRPNGAFVALLTFGIILWVIGAIYLLAADRAKTKVWVGLMALAMIFVLIAFAVKPAKAAPIEPQARRR